MNLLTFVELSQILNMENNFLSSQKMIFFFHSMRVGKMRLVYISKSLASSRMMIVIFQPHILPQKKKSNIFKFHPNRLWERNFIARWKNYIVREWFPGKSDKIDLLLYVITKKVDEWLSNLKMNGFSIAVSNELFSNCSNHLKNCGDLRHLKRMENNVFFV